MVHLVLTVVSKPRGVSLPMYTLTHKSVVVPTYVCALRLRWLVFMARCIVGKSVRDIHNAMAVICGVLDGVSCINYIKLILPTATTLDRISAATLSLSKCS